MVFLVSTADDDTLGVLGSEGEEDMDMIYAVPFVLRTRERGLTPFNFFFYKCSCSERDPLASLVMYIFKEPFPGWEN